MTSAAIAASAAPWPANTTSAWTDPDIQVVDVDLAGDRRLIVQHSVVNGTPARRGASAGRVLQHLADLWGYDVLLREVDPVSGASLREHAVSPPR